jgi:hypothetical protein
MKLKTIFSTLCVVSIVVGCQQVPTRMVASPFTIIDDRITKVVRWPPIGSTNVSSIGDSLVQTYLKTTGTAFQVADGTVGDLLDESLGGGCTPEWVQLSLPNGAEEFVVKDFSSEDPLLDEALICTASLPNNALQGSQPLGPWFNGYQAGTPMVCKSKIDEKFYIVGSATRATDCLYGDYKLSRINRLPEGSVTTVSKAVVSDDDYKYELIYNGRLGSGLKFIYREFYGDMARPSFTQDIQYDLSLSNIIGFKNAQIEVLEATNTSLEYSVVSHF